jgi:hypothetical protein
VTLFPPAVAAVTVLLDGRPVPAYTGAVLAGGHVYGPLRPFVVAIAQESWYAHGMLVIRRDGRTAYVRMQPRTPDALDDGWVPLAPLLRALGAQVQYDGPARTLDVRLPSTLIVRQPAPWNRLAPSAPPAPVFTPTPVPTPRPVWTGVPLPRRTPLPVVVPTPTVRLW